MNHYAQALAELQAQPDHELKQIGDQWQTPKALAWGLFHQFAPTLGPVVLDMFADDCNHLVPHYYDAEDNALTQELAADLRRLGGAAYANPPYSRPCTDSEGNPITGMEAILNYCREQRALGAKIMLLIKAATSETWWPEDADFIQFISGRIGFEVPSWYVPRDPKKDKPSSSGFASAVVIFDVGWQGERRPEERLRRDDLITTGTIILDMIHRQAVELTLAADHVIRNATPKLAPVVTQEQPAETEPAAGEPPAADDNEASASAAAELGYADATSIMAKQIECVDLGEEQQDTVRGYVQGWLDEPYPLSEIFYRLDLAVANLLAGKPIHQGFVAEDSRSPALPHRQRHPAVKGIIYQIDDADILTPASRRAGRLDHRQPDGARRSAGTGHRQGRRAVGAEYRSHQPRAKPCRAAARAAGCPPPNRGTQHQAARGLGLRLPEQRAQSGWGCLASLCHRADSPLWRAGTLHRP
ncbi:phage N-6-adenine-methyltransferase [Aeromonas hydrophila]